MHCTNYIMKVVCMKNFFVKCTLIFFALILVAYNVPLALAASAEPAYILRDNKTGKELLFSDSKQDRENIFRNMMGVEFTVGGGKSSDRTLILNKDLEVPKGVGFNFYPDYVFEIKSKEGKHFSIYNESVAADHAYNFVISCLDHSSAKKGILKLKNVTIDGKNRTQAISISKNCRVELENVDIVDCKSDDTHRPMQGAITMMDNAELVIKDGQFSGNEGLKYGSAIAAIGDAKISIDGTSFVHNSGSNNGVIYIQDKVKCKIENAQFTDNSVNRKGGAIYADISGDALLIKSCAFLNNTSAWKGGAIHIEHGSLDISSSKFIGNKASTGQYSGYGGAINLELSKVDPKGAITINKCTFQQNTAGFIKDGAVVKNGFGGAISRYAAHDEAPAKEQNNISITNCTFANNLSTGLGGACYTAGQYNIQKSVFKTNQSAFQGGALYTVHGVGKIADSEFTQNETIVSAGAIGVFDGASLSVSNSEFNNNATLTKEDDLGAGGAIFVRDTAKTALDGNVALLVESTKFTGNESRYGGAINTKQNSRIKDSTFDSNKAVGTNDIPANPSQDKEGGYAGAIYIAKGNINIIGSTFANNNALKSGGAIVLRQDANLSITNNTKFNGNIAQFGEGGAIQDLLYEYENPISDTSKFYSNLISDSSTIFYGNKAARLFNPPLNYAEYKDKIQYKSNSLAEGIYSKSLLNNYDINYKNPRCFVSYHPNGAKGDIYVDINNSINIGTGPYDYTILANDIPRFKYAGHEFISWNTEKDGSGTNYKAGDTINVDHDIMLYAIWTGKANNNPTNTPSVKVPKTGDSFPIRLYVVLAFISILAIISIMLIARRSYKQN